MILFLVGILLIAVLTVFICYVVIKLDLVYQTLHPPDVTSKDNGGRIVADILKAHGVEFIYTLCGGHISPICVACHKLGIRVIDTRHEVTAAFAADATARLSRNIGVVVVTAGPGVTNTVTALKNAQMAESPVLLIGGAAATAAKGRGALQDVDQLSVLKPICKFTVAITRVRDIAPSLRKAISIAKSGTPGPVFVEMPVDVLYPYEMVINEALHGMRSQTIGQRILSWYLHKHTGRIFAGAFDPTIPFCPLPFDFPVAAPSKIQRAAELLSKSKRPILVLGSQFVLPPTDLNEVAAVIEKMGIPTFLAGMSRGLLGVNGVVYCRHNRKQALKNADFVLIAGAVCDFRLSYGHVLPKEATIVAVNRSKEQLLKNAGITWKPTLTVQADAASFIISLSVALKSYTADASWLHIWREADNKRDVDIREQAAAKPAGKGLNPLSLLSVFDSILKPNSVLVVDGGDFVGCAAYIVKPTGPLGWLDPGAFGTLGVGAGFALGAKLCRPDADVWVIFGDGSLGYSLAEFDTFVRHKLPIMALVGNDACWSQIYREQSQVFASDVACMLAYTDYHRVVEALGGNGAICNEDLAPSAVRQCLEDSANTARTTLKPVLVNCIIGRTSFREGSLAV